MSLCLLLLAVIKYSLAFIAIASRSTVVLMTFTTFRQI